MLKDVPVVPPDSVIKTFSHLRSDHVDLVMTQDDQGLGEGSMIIRQGDWAKFFLDSWFDPLYRTYNFQKAEVHALVSTMSLLTQIPDCSTIVLQSANTNDKNKEHLVQWHPTVLARLAIVPQRTMNAYNTDGIRHTDRNCLFKDGDFVIHLAGCTNGEFRNCEHELEPFYAIWEDQTSKGTV